MKLGVALPITETEDGQMARYREIREMATMAEAAGFDSIWVYDHLVYRFPEQPTRGIWEAWTLLTALAEATTRVELGVLVLCAPFRNPALTAKMADTLEEVSNGRLILGLGAGWHEPEFTAFGYPFDHLVDRFEESIKIIQPVAKTGGVDFAGSYHQAPNCVSRPRGPRPDGPPILIASFRPRMLRLTAQYADAWNTAWLGWPTKLAERRAELETACAEVGRDPKTLEVTVGVSVAYPDLDGGIKDADDRDKHLSGTPADIAAGFRAYASEGVGHIICAPAPNTMPSLERLSQALQVYREL